jgi:hypothetical protein
LNFAEKVIKAVLQFAGFLLILLLFSEEFKRLVSWFWEVIRQEPRLKIILYPLALLLMVVAGALIVHSIITLFTTVLFSYE